MSAESILRTLANAPDLPEVMPALFIGHGNPMNAVEDSEFSKAWASEAASLPRPRAVLCISAHWQTAGSRVTAMAQPKTIHDFYGFPEELFAKNYPAPGSPELARLAQTAARDHPVDLDQEWGLDHGTWSVLCRMYPAADIPVVQLSLDERKSPEAHYDLGRELASLRRKGVLIIGSGNIVHNLRSVAWSDTAYDWAVEFDGQVRDLILAGDHQSIIQYPGLGAAARKSVPTPEHYLPLLYVLAAQGQADRVKFFADKVTLGSISMRSVRLG